MRISCSMNLLSGLVPAWAHICLYSHWFQCGEIIILPSYSVSYTQAICDDPKQPLNPAFSMNDRSSVLHVLCLASGVTLLCSFLWGPQGGRLVWDWSLLHCEPSSQKSTEVLNYTSPTPSYSMCVSVSLNARVHKWHCVYLFLASLPLLQAWLIFQWVMNIYSRSSQAARCVQTASASTT